MFVNYSLRNSVSYQAIAMLVAATMLAWAVGAQFVGITAEAANVVEFKSVMSDSRAGQASSHTISFELPSGAADDETIILEFDANLAVGAATIADDIAVSVNGTPVTVDATGTGANWAAAVAGQNVTLTVGSDLVPADVPVVVTLGEAASGSGSDFITNPSGAGATTSSYTIDITEASTITDFGQTRVAITDNVLVTAEVATNFNFTVVGKDAGFTIPGVALATGATTTSNSLPFGELEADTPVTLAHELNVTTNARNGFAVTVEQTGDLQSSTGAVIDSFTDGTYVSSPTAWASPGDDITDDKEWGHWGLTSDDDIFNGGVNDAWVAASTTPHLIFAHGSSSDGTTVDVGSTTVGYQIEITPLQEAGNDYTTNLIYIATPTF